MTKQSHYSGFADLLAYLNVFAEGNAAAKRLLDDVLVRFLVDLLCGMRSGEDV